MTVNGISKPIGEVIIFLLGIETLFFFQKKALPSWAQGLCPSRLKKKRVRHSPAG